MIINLLCYHSHVRRVVGACGTEVRFPIQVDTETGEVIKFREYAGQMIEIGGGRLVDEEIVKLKTPVKLVINQGGA